MVIQGGLNTAHQSLVLIGMIIKIVLQAKIHDLGPKENL